VPARSDELTFGEVVERGGVREQASLATREVIRRSNAEGAEAARVHLFVISCDTCTAPKACCTFVTTAYLYEALPIASRLVRERRDTPALRKRLRDAADAMETSRSLDYRRPCVFLDEAERCTIYEDRPSVCGTHLVSSPAEQCAQAGGRVEKVVAPLQESAPPQFAQVLGDSIGLESIGMHYFGAMPRMVLLCLEAWSRPDYVRYLAKHGRVAAERFRKLRERVSPAT
jgi:Fe-S-cluster containining protein